MGPTEQFCVLKWSQDCQNCIFEIILIKIDNFLYHCRDPFSLIKFSKIWKTHFWRRDRPTYKLCTFIFLRKSFKLPKFMKSKKILLGGRVLFGRNLVYDAPMPCDSSCNRSCLGTGVTFLEVCRLGDF